eukprot:gene16112-19110_t
MKLDIETVKQQARPWLPTTGWRKYGYAKEAPSVWKGEYDGRATDIDVVDARDLDLASFRERYENTFQPVVLTGLSDDWEARQTWEPSALANSHLGSCDFDVGDEDVVKMDLSSYLAYASATDVRTACPLMMKPRKNPAKTIL